MLRSPREYRMSKQRMIRKASNLDEIRKYCKGEPLTGEGLQAFFVETDQARDPHQNTRQRLCDALKGDRDARVLFYGHRGCGKSTELNKFLSEHPDEFLAAQFSVQDELPPTNIRAEDLLLVMTERVLSTAKNAGLDVKDSLLKPVMEYFANATKTQSQGRSAESSVEAGVDASHSFLGKLLGILAKVRGEIKIDSRSEETLVTHLRKRPAALLNSANQAFEAVRGAMPQGKRLLLVVEDLDKLDLKQAREIYLENVNLLTGVRANVIYTIPIFLFHSPDAGIFRHRFDDVVSLPMIDVLEPPTKPAPGFDTVKQIVLARVQEELIAPQALNLLVEKTGGVLRHVFEALHYTSCMVGAETPLREDHIRYGLNKLAQEFWPQISLPSEPIPGGPQTVSELYDRLAEHARQQQEGRKPLPQSDAITQILLKSCALVEYNGKGWFGVHPLVIERLREMGRLD